MKTCCECKQVKTFDLFHKRSDRPGYRHKCKACWYKKSGKPPGGQKRFNDEELKEHRKASMAKHRATATYAFKHSERQARRRAGKLMATPEWLSPDQLNNIKAYYEVAKGLSDQFGQRFDVDHIIPLKGKTVCGLHVPWNLQVLDRAENIKKSNKV